MAKKKDGTTVKDIAILESPDAKIHLPKNMTKKEAIKWLIRQEEEDEKEIGVYYEINCYPIEGAYALYRALKHVYGFTQLADTPGFFGPQPPMMVGLPISPTETVQVPWGSIKVPNVDGRLQTGGKVKPDGQVVFTLQGKVKRKDETVVNELVKVIKEFAFNESIYKGKAIKVQFGDDPENVDFTYTPSFMDTSTVSVEDLIFPNEVAKQVEVSLFTPIEKTGLVRQHGVPLKRGILLEGPYGTGKTLCAFVTAKKCEENGWTFLMLEKTTDLKHAIQMARQYQPCVVFAEDIDRAVEGERSVDMDSILNTIDGIDSKTTEVIVVLTTNHVDKINRAMLRPGRLDDIIPVREPDAGAAVRLVNTYSRGLIAPAQDLTSVGKALAGMKPAVIRETVERAKLASLTHLKDGEVLSLHTSDFLAAAYSMRQQLQLMDTPVEKKYSDREKAADILGAHLKQGLAALLTPMSVNGSSEPIPMAAVAN